MRRSYSVRLTTLGDLLLDVIVHLDDPLVPGDDQMAETRAVAGGQAANVAAWARDARRRGALRRPARRRRRRRARRPRAARARRRGRRPGRRAGRASSSRSPRTATARWPRTAAVRPTSRRSELDEAWFDCDVLHLSGLLPAPRADRLGALPQRRGATRARRRASSSVDVSTWTLVDDAFRGAAARPRARRRLRERARARRLSARSTRAGC